MDRNELLASMIQLVIDENDVDVVKETYLTLAINGVLTSGKGEVNKNWPRLPFDNVAEYRAGRTPARQENRYWSSATIPWVSIADLVDGGQVTFTKESVSVTAQNEVFKSPPSPIGTLLMSFKLTIGKISTLACDAYFNEAIIAIQPKEIVSVDFLKLALPNIARGGESKNAIKGRTLNRDSLGKLVVPIPSKVEQDEIVNMINSFNSELDKTALSLTERNRLKKHALVGISHSIIESLEID